MARVLTQIRIDEASAVDRGAGEGVKIVLMKRDDTARSFNHFMKAAAADDGNDAGGGNIINQHPVVQAARLLVASGKFGDHGDALDYLLNTSGGRALLTHLKADNQPPAKEFPMDSIHAIMKSAGIAATCAQIVAKGSTSISEHEIVDAVTKIAAERFPNMSPAQAYSKVHTDQGAEGLSLRKAINVAKASAPTGYPFPVY
jgi:hypothetical protein